MNRAEPNPPFGARAIDAWRSPGALTKAARSLTPWFALALLAAAPLLARMYVLYIPAPLNPDEAQWTVSARSILTDPIVWRSTDMQTSGPLNAFAISWPILFGLTPSIFTSRLTGLLLQSLCLLGMASLIRRGQALSPGTAAVLAAAAWLAFTGDASLDAYSSELVSLALIVLFCIVYVRLPVDASAGPGLALCGLIAACLPFAKMQSALFFVLLQIVCITRLFLDVVAKRATLSEALLYVLASCVPVFLFVAPLFLVNEQDAFFIGYLKLAAGYGGERSFRILRPVLPLIGIMLLLLLVTSVRLFNNLERQRLRHDILFLSFAIWPITVLTVLLPGRNFTHYQFYAIICLPLSVILAQYALPAQRHSGRAIARGSFVVAVTMIAVVADLKHQHWLMVLLAQSKMDAAFARQGSGPASRPLFAWTGATSADTLLMWGWAPELTAYAGMRSADRASIGEYLIRPNNGMPYFRARLLKDVARTNPAIVIDAVRKGYFFNNYPEYNPNSSDLRSFPELYNVVSRDFEQIVAGTRCAAIYLRRDKVAALQAAEIPLRSSIAALVDGSTTETCDDWWAPESRDAIAEFTVEPPAPVGELWILSSRGGPNRDRGTSRVRLVFHTSAGARSEWVTPLYDYPDWTVITPPEKGPIAEIEIETLDSVGEGPALAQVKAFKGGW